MTSVEEKVTAGLKMLKLGKFEELDPWDRVGLVMYFAREPLSPAEIAKFAKVEEGQVKIILEGKPT